MNNHSTQINPLPTKAQLARELGVSRSYITLISQGKKKPSPHMANKLTQLGLTVSLSELNEKPKNACTEHQTPQIEHLTFNQGVTG